MKKYLIWIVAGIGMLSLAYLVSFALDKMIDDSTNSGKQGTEVVDNANSKAKQEIPNENKKAEQVKPKNQYSIPQSPSCTVRGRVQHYNHQYVLVIGEHDGQVCPGGGSSEGIISDVNYNSSSGHLRLTICNMSYVEVGYYDGYLKEKNGTYEYSGSFSNIHGRSSSFSMSGSR